MTETETMEEDNQINLDQAKAVQYNQSEDNNGNNSFFLPLPLLPPHTHDGIHGQIVPNLQQISSGIWSDASYNHQYDEEYYDEIATSMENNEDSESDYDFDFDIEKESINEEDNEQLDGEEEEENEEESFEDEDEDSDENLIDDLQIKFQNLVFSTIAAAEDFLDHPTTVHLAVLNSGNGLGLEDTQDQRDNELFCSKETHFESQQQLENTNNEKLMESHYCTFPHPQGTNKRDIEIQTDDDILRSSGTLVPSNEAKAILKAEQAEFEIGELEVVQESFLADLEFWRTSLEETDRNTEDLKIAERSICKIQEGLEAVDHVIEMKSEVVAEAQGAGSRTNGGFPYQEMEFSQIVTDLESLSVQDLRRLVGFYFEKSVELRYSSNELEKDLDMAHNRQDDLSKRYSRKKEQMRELEEQHQSRILEFVCSNADPSYYSRFRRKEEQLQAARKRQQDLEKSLTALLVRHGYLLDGVDYDVKQVVRTLGIDETQLASLETKGRVTRRGGISAEVMEGASGGKKEVAGGQGPGPSRGQQAYDKPSARSSGSPRKGAGSSRAYDGGGGGGGGGAGRDQKRHSHTATPTPHQQGSEFEVRRDKRRITIQPSTSSGPPKASSSSSGGKRGGGGGDGGGSSSNRNTYHRQK